MSMQLAPLFLCPDCQQAKSGKCFDGHHTACDHANCECDCHERITP